MGKKIYGIFDTIRSAGIVSIFAFMVVLSLTQIFLRYFSFLGVRLFTWGDEIIRLSSIWVVFLAASLGVKEGAHLSVSFFLEKYVPPKIMGFIQKMATGIVLLALAFLIFYGGKYTLNATNKTLQNLDISIAWFYAAIPIGCVYLFADYLLILICKEHPYSRMRLRSDKTSQTEEG